MPSHSEEQSKLPDSSKAQTGEESLGLTCEKDILLSNALPYQPLSKHYPKLQALSNLMSWSVIILFLLVLEFAIDKISLHFMLLPGLLLFTLTSTHVSYLSAKACGYYQAEFDIYFKQGLWWKKQTALNFSRIQHIDISHGPLERRFKMATIKFFTAGGAGSDLRISGLSNEQAEKLRTDILHYAQQNIITDELAENPSELNHIKDDSSVSFDQESLSSQPELLEPNEVSKQSKPLEPSQND
jgi:uncharacterized protein